MKLLIVPAVSALLFAGLPAQGHSFHQLPLQITDSTSGGEVAAISASGRGVVLNQVAANDSTDRKDRGDKNRSESGRNQGRGQGSGAATMGGSQGGGGGVTGDRGKSEMGSHTGGAVTTGGSYTGGGGAVSGDRGRFGKGSRTSGAVTTGGSYTGGGGAVSGDHRGRSGKDSRSGSAETTGGGVFTGDRGRSGKGGRSGSAAITSGGQTGVTTFGTRPSNWNRYPRQFDRHVYERNITSPRHYRWRGYDRPSGWYYQRWSYGQIFPSIFWASNYWLTDYWMFDLPIPPYGYVWVRYGDDAVLINRRSGRILQVVYGVFY